MCFLLILPGDSREVVHCEESMDREQAHQQHVELWAVGMTFFLFLSLTDDTCSNGETPT